MGIFNGRNNRNNSRNNNGNGRGRRNTISTWPVYALLLISFILYLVFQKNAALSLVFGAAIFFMIIILILLEVVNGVKEQGIGRNILEIVVAVALVLLIWFGLQFVLGTGSPIDVVPSCSMLPALQRGDMILLQGASPAGIKAPVVNITQSMYNSAFNGSLEFLQCVAYNESGSTLRVSQFLKPGYSVGLLSSSNGSGSIVNASQQDDPVQYTCGVTNAIYQNGTRSQIVYTSAITIGNATANTVITGDKNNSIVVYQTVPQDLFYREGDGYIVHRAYALLNVSGKYYVLTKGDNNPGLDIQYYNYPVAMRQVEGKVLFSIPYLGYLKLILSNNFVEPTGCNYTIQN